MLAILEREAGNHFDSALVAHLRSIAVKAFREIGGATEFELQAWPKAWVNPHRSSLHTKTGDLEIFGEPPGPFAQTLFGTLMVIVFRKKRRILIRTFNKFAIQRHSF